MSAASDAEAHPLDPVPPAELVPSDLVEAAYRAGFAAAAGLYAERTAAAIADAAQLAAGELERVTSNAESLGYQRAEEYMLSELRGAVSDEKKLRAIVKRLEERNR